jgi:predicted HAD superfamily Cof-like phosphohydrolase
MNKMQKQVQEFHEKFQVNIGATPQFPSKERVDLRFKLIEEEFKELRDAYALGDFVLAADALGDILYVVFGTGVEFGVDLEQVVDEIHRSNLTKLLPNGEPLLAENGKVLKGPNYELPDVRRVLFGK